MKCNARSSMLLLAALLGGCIAPVPTESEQEMETAPGKELVPTISEDIGWPGTSETSGDMEVTYQDDQKLEITAPRHVVRSASTFTIDVDQGWGQSISTSMTYVLYHRPYQSDAEWKPVGLTIGSYGTATVSFTKDGTFLLWGHLKVDMSMRRFTGFNWLLKDAAFFEFENCGVWEENPEFGIVALPMSNWWNMADDYSYDITLTCTDESGAAAACPAY